MAHNERLAQYDYKHQKASATQRGLKFDFTFEEWVDWWVRKLGKNWQQKRGKRKGQYCMARSNDTGPYASWNVDCCLTTENTGRSNRGENSSRTRLTNRQVLEIFKSDRTNRELSLAYKTTERTVAQIKMKATWKHLTNGLIKPNRNKRKRGHLSVSPPQ